MVDSPTLIPHDTVKPILSFMHGFVTRSLGMSGTILSSDNALDSKTDELAIYWSPRSATALFKRSASSVPGPTSPAAPQNLVACNQQLLHAINFASRLMATDGEPT